MKLLVIEDELVLRTSMVDFFSTTMTVNAVGTLAAASDLVTKQTFEAIIIDLTLPDGDGLTWLAQWRPLLNSQVLVLTANDEESAEIMGFQLAADYVLKPTSLRVLQARLARLLPQPSLTIGDLALDLTNKQVYRGNQLIELTETEWRLLVYFAQNQRQLLSRDQLLTAMWDARSNFVNDNTLTVTIKRLREKLESDPAHPQSIRTIRGMGYFIDVGE